MHPLQVGKHLCRYVCGLLRWSNLEGLREGKATDDLHCPGKWYPEANETGLATGALSVTLRAPRGYKFGQVSKNECTGVAVGGLLRHIAVTTRIVIVSM